VNVQGSIEEQLAQALKKLEDAETRCQATTREIWQIDMALGKEEDRANAAEARCRELEQRIQELEAGGSSGPAVDTSALEAELAEWRGRAEQAEARIAAAESLLRDMQTRSEQQHAEVQTRVQELEAQLQAAGAGEARLHELEGKNRDLQDDLLAAEARVRAADRRAGELESQLQAALANAGSSQDLQDDLQAAEARLRLAEERLAEAQRSSEERSRLAEILESRLGQAETRATEAEARLAETEERARAAESREDQSGRLAEVEAHKEEVEVRLRAAEERLGDLLVQLKDAEPRQREAEARAQAAEERLAAAQSELGELRARLEAAPTGGPDPALQAQLDAAKLRAYEAEDRARLAEERVRQTLEQVQALEARVAEASALPATAGSPELEARLQKAEEMAQLQAEKAELLTARSNQALERAQLAEEKVALAEARAAQADERALAAEQRVREAENRARQAESGSGNIEERLRRAEERARDSDKVYAAAEEKAREAEQVSKESWTRVREAELKANQASVELKKLHEKIAEYEKRTQESDRETQRLAFQDALTGLPNYNLINQYLDFTVKQCMRYKRVSALLVIDIDRFKVFNEAMGFKAGDELLVSIAERLKTAVRDTDSLGRRGEDEFLILLSELNPGDESAGPEVRRLTLQANVELVAKRVMNSLATPFVVQGQKYYIQASIGISLCPDDAETPSAMFENADTAMYHVKETGRNRYHFYSADMRKRQEKRLTLDTQLRHALERGEFQLLYQPVINLAAGKGKGSMVGVEALIRWNHRIDGMVTPDYFLPAAEETGMIVPIGHWVVAQVCAMMREWLASGLRIFASINLSKRQLLQADLADTVLSIVSEHRVPPEVIYMDIAEGVNTLNPDLMDRVIAELGQAGIRIAIDDFGIGYSSLARINPTYTKILKIDASIIRGLPNDKQSSTVCIAAINLARSLGLLPLAEGVENANQVKFLTKYECALAQGFFFSEPVPPAEIGAMHRNKKVWKF